MALSDTTDSEEDGKKMLVGTEFSCGSSKNKLTKKIANLSSDKANGSLCVVNKKSKISTDISILVASLVKNLVTAYESDKDQADLKYRYICDQLYQMNMIDESYQMKEFEGILMQYHCIVSNFLTAKGRPVLMHSGWPDANLLTSHYYREFDELELIGKGGFGKVYKARNKLDGREYAIKKIPIHLEGLQHVKNYLTEVETFSSLNHPNVVQYRGAWLDISESSNMLMEGDSDDELFSQGTTDLEENPILSFEKAKEDTSDFEVVFEHSINSKESNKEESSTHSEKKLKRKKWSSISEGGNAVLPIEEKKIIEVYQRMSEKWTTLYIQMALCQSTLKQWLSQRNSPEKPIDPMTAVLPVKIVQDSVVREILKQLLEGIQYIHSKRIVHHDIKPSNIFLQTDNGKLFVQLGDFGLSCPLQNVRHSLGFGTKLYAAPEQLAGNCDPKSDMFSLGIVLFELVETFTTDMEKNIYIEELKKSGVASPRVVMQHPQFADIIQRLVNKLPQKRPDAHEVLAEISGDSSIAELEIRELKSQLAKKEEEILQLKEKLKLAGLTNLIN